MKYQDFYTNYNRGKSGKARKKNRTLGNKKMRNTLKKDIKIIYGCTIRDIKLYGCGGMEDTYA